ncbi:unnamed protein product [Chironomus riparius]|uniref:Uncharacterized protein n=1 Tax=Chironomus riparius TaxID=315576 RepID=A0A9N9WZG7_9DIPT|nr:unnamed protein product [Chironomus riparius]
MKLDLQKYFEISTVHGLAYISKRFHIVERLFWLIAMILSVIYASNLIVELVIKIANFPIVTYLSEQSFSVLEINFPAVTVCPQQIFELPKGHRPSINKYSLNIQYEKHTFSVLHLESAEVEPELVDEIKYGNISYIEFLKRIENGIIKPQDLGYKILKRLQIIDLITNRGVFNKLNFSIPTDDFLEVANQFDKELGFDLSYYWINEDQQYITEIITEWGLCFTYNIAFSHDLLNINSTSDDFHYEYFPRWFEDINIEINKFPISISTSKAGLRAGFHPDINKLGDLTKAQYTVIFHDPFELPTANSKVIKLNIYYQTNVLVVPQINSIDESLVEYGPSERNCYLENEKILKFFKVYTKNNCENECLSDFMLNHCGCIEFFMIRNSTSRICSANEINCYSKAKSDFEENNDFCECFEPCDFVKYNFEIKEYGTIDSNSGHLRETLGFQLQYKTNEINQQVRKKQFNWLDFFSYVGGILGLFAGFSALSFVEIIYWFTIRVLFKHFGKRDAKVYPFEENNTKCSKFIEFLQSFLSESSIHGLWHIHEFSLISRQVMKKYEIFNEILITQASAPNSRVIAYDDNYKSVDDIPFPAITIVPEFAHSSHVVWKIYFKKTGSGFNADELLNNETTREGFILDVAQRAFCYEQYDGYDDNFDFSYIPYIIRALKKNSNIDWFRNQFSLLNGKYEPKYSEIRTSRGMGFTFNMIDADKLLNFDQIHLDFNYTRNITTNSDDSLILTKYPLTFNRQDKVIFKAKIKMPFNDMYETMICIKQSFMIHHSDDLPTFSQRKEFLNFDYGTTVDVTVTPEIIRTDHDLKFLKPEIRGCYFEGEKSLKYFKTYSQKNCDIECLTNVTEKSCGCVDINQPFKNIHDVCQNISRMLDNCFRDLQHQIYVFEHFSSEQNCSCLPLCNSVGYNINYNIRNDQDDNETTIIVTMNMDDIILFRRYQQFTFSDVVSYVGGLLGLFAGISMLSIVEFFYFFTIRLLVNLWRISRDSEINHEMR